MAPLLIDGDRRAVQKAAANALARPEVQWVIVQDGDGQAVAAAVRGGFDGVAIRNEIVRGAWLPNAETRNQVRLPASGPVLNVTLPIVSPAMPGGPAPDRLGTLSVGLGSPRPIDRLLAHGRRVTDSWTSPLRHDVSTKSRQAWTYYHDGVRAIGKFYESEARTAWLMALEEDPNFAMALVRLGRLAHELGDEESAVTWYRRALAEQERVTDRERLEIRLLGAELEDREADERAIEAELIERFDEDAEVLVIAGNQHLNEGRPELALADLEKARALDPELTTVWNLIGYAEADLGRWPRAEDALEKYVFLHQGQANPHDSLGELYLRTGRFLKALHQFELATEIKPDFAWAHYHLALVNAELGRWDASLFAIQRAREASRLSPEDRQWSRAEILLHIRAGRVADSVRLAALHRAEHALEPADHGLMAQVALASGDRNAARAAVQELLVSLQADVRRKKQELKVAPGYHRLLELQGLLHDAEGRPREAVEQLDAAHAVAFRWEARQRIERETIRILIESGRSPEAIRRLEAVLARCPDDPTACWWLGRALELEGRREEARASFERAALALVDADDDDPLTVAVREACRPVVGG